MNTGDFDGFHKQQRGSYPRILPYSVRLKENVSSLTIEMNPEKQQEPSKNQLLKDTVARVVTQKHLELCTFFSHQAVSISKDERNSPTICFKNKASFDAKVDELTDLVNRRVKVQDAETVRTLVIQQVMEELWPLICLQLYAKDVEIGATELQDRVILLNNRIRPAIRRDFQEVASKTRAVLSLLQQERAWSTPKAYDAVALAQKLLEDQAHLMQRLSASQEGIDRRQFKADLSTLLTQLGGNSHSSSFTSWVGKFVPNSIKRLAEAPNWMIKGVQQSPADQDAAHLKFLNQFQGAIEELRLRKESIQDQQEEGVDDELKALLQDFSHYEEAVAYLKDYFAADEPQEAALHGLTDQIEGLQRGECDFSVEAYRSVMQQASRFRAIGEEHKEHGKGDRLLKVIEQKTASQEKQAVEALEDLSEELFSALKAEHQEAVAHWKEAFAQETPPDRFLNTHRLLLVVAEASKQLVADLTSISADSSLSPLLVAQSQKDLKEAQAIAGQIEADLARALQDLETNPRLKESVLSDIGAENLDAEQYRIERSVLTKVQKRRQWQQRKFEKLNESGSETGKQFLRFFFFYLQAVSQPLIAHFGTPVGVRDYNYYVRMMAESSHTANATEESYDYYLGKARSFVGVDHEFLDHYDQFLRNHIHFQYNPLETAQPRGTLAGEERATPAESIHQWMQDFAPESVMQWTAQFLGLTPEGKTAASPSAWDQWVASSIMPQVKHHYFKGLVDYFDQIGDVPSPPLTDDHAAQFGYHCYKMYASLKSPQADESFTLHRQAASTFEFGNFLNDYTSYLKANPPHIDPSRLHEVKIEPVNALIGSAAYDPGMGLDDVVSQASRINSVFYITWAKTVAKLVGSFFQGSDTPPSVVQTEEKIGKRLQEAVSQELPVVANSLDHLNQMDQEVESLEENLPTVLGHHDTEVEQIVDTVSDLKEHYDLFENTPVPEELSIPETIDWLREANQLTSDVDKIFFKYEQIPLEKQQAALEVLRKIIDGPTLFVDDKFLLHVLGDPFGSGTGLEGLPSIKPLEYVLAFLTHTFHVHRTSSGLMGDLESLPETDQAALLKSLEKATTLYQHMSRSPLNIFRDQLGEMLRTADYGESILLPGGWAGRPGHAIYYEFSKQENDLYTFRIYNTGAGLQYHPGASVQFDSLAVPFVENRDVPLANILRSPVIKMLQELETLIPKKKSYSEDDIYGTLRGIIGGKPTNRVHESNELRSYQRSGTCSMMSLITTLSYASPEREFLHSQFELGLKVLDEYETSNRFRIQRGDELATRLLGKSLQEFSRQLLTFRSRQIISDLEYLYAHEHVVRIQNTVNAGLQLLSKGSAKNTVTLDSRPILSSIPLELKEEAIVSNHLPTRTTPVAVIAFDDWNPKINTLSLDLDRFYLEMQKAYDINDHRTVVYATTALMERISAGEKILAKFNSASDDLRKSVIHGLFNVAKVGFNSHLKLTEQEPFRRDKLFPRYLLAQTKLWTLCNALVMQLLQMPGNEFLGNRPLQDYLMNRPSMSFRLFDPSLDMELKHVAAYWRSIKPPVNREFTNNKKNPFSILTIATSAYNYRYYLVSKKIMDYPDVREKIEAHYPEELNQQDFLKIHFAMSDRFIVKNYKEYDNKLNLLPDFIYQLRGLNAVNQYLTLYAQQLLSGGNLPSFYYESEQDRDYAYWYERINGMEHSHKEIERPMGATVDMAYSSIDDAHLKSLVTTDGEIKRESPDSLLWAQTQARLDHPLQEQRELMNLLSKEQLQVRETLTYFLNNPHKLKNEDYRTIFNSLLFDPGRLLNELLGNHEDANHLVHKLAHFVSQQYLAQRDQGNWLEASYFAGLNYRCRRYVDFVEKRQGTTFSSKPFIDTRQELRGVLKHQDLSVEERISLSLQLALTYEDVATTVTEAAEFLSSVVTSRNNEQTIRMEDRFALEGLLDKHRALFQQLVSGEQRHLFLNQMMQRLDVNVGEQTWIEHEVFPFFRNDDGSVVVDVASGTLYSHSGKMVPLSPNILNDQDFERAIGKEISLDAREIAPLVYELRGSNGALYRVHKNIDAPLTIQKLMKHAGTSAWYQYAPKRSLEGPLSEHAGLLLDNQHWYTDKGSSPEMLIFGANKSTPSYRAELSQDLKKLVSVKRLGDSRELWLGESPPAFISAFEEPSMVLSWLDSKGRLALLELPRYDLQFEMREGKAYCQAYPGYYLSEEQSLPALQGFDHYLLLKNEQGKQVVLIPKQAFIPDEKRTGCLETSKATLDRQLTQSGQTYFDYRLDSANHLIPSTEEARYHLAMIYLWKMDYTKAYEYLRGSNVSLRPFDQSEVDALMAIVELKESSNDKDPKAIALYLYASYLSQRNASDFSRHVVLPDDATSLTDYLAVLDRVGAITLTSDEELFLLKKGPRSMAMEHRLRYLTDSGSSPRLPLFTVDAPKPAQNRRMDPATLLRQLESAAKDKLSSARKASPETAGSVLDPHMGDHFKLFYRLLKGELHGEEANSAYEQVTGMPSLPSSLALQRKELDQVLEIMASRASDLDLSLLAILRAVYEHAASFPLYSEIENRYESHKFNDLVVEPAKNILKDEAQKAFASETLDEESRVILSRSEDAWPDEPPVDMPFQMSITSYGTDFSYDLSSVVHSISLNERNYYQIADRRAFAHVHTSIDQQILAGESSLNTLEKQIIEIANREPASKVDQASRSLEQLGHDSQQVSTNDLIHLFLTRDMARFHEANPELSVDTIYELNNQVQEYLSRATHLQHLRRLSVQMGQIEENPGEKSSGQLSQMLEELIAIATSKRAYQVETQPEYLVFEYYMNMLLRPSQIENLDLLRIKDGQIRSPDQLGVVLEAIMGSGKTEVLLPLLGQLCANGDNLCLGVIPEALLPDMSERLSQILGNVFRKSVEVFQFNREPRPSLDDLQMMLQRFNQAITSKRMFFMGSSAIQGLYLKLWESWSSYVESPTDINRQEFEVLREIWRVLKTKGNVVIDESDQILNARKELHFTLGGARPLDPLYGELASFLYGLLLDPNVVPDMRFDFGSAVPDAAPFTPEAYHANIAPRLVDEVIKQKCGVADPSIQDFFSHLDPVQISYIRAYLSGEDNPQSLSFVTQIRDSKIKDLLALAKEEITVLIPLTASKLVNQYYGSADKDSGLRLAIPYHGSNSPSPQSRYGVYETLNYTIQLGLVNGIDRDQVNEEIKELQAQAIALNNQNKPYIGSAVHQRFVELTEGDERIKLFGAEKWVDVIAERINAHTDKKLGFIQRYNIPQVTENPHKLSTNAQVFNFLFRAVSGFTGTQWNSDTFPSKLEVISSDEVAELTLSILRKNSQRKVHVVSSFDSSQMMENIFERHPELQHVHALIDAAGNARGTSNAVQARRWLDLPSTKNRTPPINGAVFYDDQERLMIWERDADKPKPFSHSKLSLDERITFYDQKHFTGANIKQCFSGVAAVTIGKNTILRDLLQAVWRMRGLNRGQRVEFIIDKDVRDIIVMTLTQITGEAPPEQLDFSHLELFVKHTQALLQGDDNFRSLKQKMDAILQEAVMEAVLSKEVTVDELTNLFPQVSRLCLTETSLSPWDLFGLPQEEKGRDEVIDAVIESKLTSAPFEALGTHAAFKGRVDQQTVKDEIVNVANISRPLVGERLLLANRSYGMESEVQTETQKETEQETEKETETERAFVASSSYDTATHPSTSRDDLRNIHYFIERPLEDKSGVYLTLNSALKNDPDLQEFQDVFDQRILGTLNLIRQADSQRGLSNPVPYQLFNFFQKSMSDILIVQNSATKDLLFVLGELNDGNAWTKLLEEDYQPAASQSAGSAKVCLYRPGLGVYRRGGDRLEIETIEKSPRFLSLLVQAKFFNGEIDYSDEELPYLKAWILEKGQVKMKHLFEQIIEWKDSNRRRFKDSPLATILDAG